MNQHILTGQVDITSNLLVGSSHLFVDTTNNRVGLVTTDPHAGLHVNSNVYVNTDLRVGSQIEINATPGRIKAATFEGDGSLIVNAPVGSLAVHSTDTGLPGTDAIVTNEGTPTAANFKFIIPRGAVGATGTAATVAVDGTTVTGAAETDASVTNLGSSSAANFRFTIPRGDTGVQGVQGIQGVQGLAGTVGVTEAIVTGAAGTSASVTNTGTSSAATLNFTVPRGNTGVQGVQGIQGVQGPAATVGVTEAIVTGAAGTNATVTNTGTSSAATLNFTVPRGDTGIQGGQGVAATVAVDATTVTGASGTNASVTNTGSSSAANFRFTIPRGADGTDGTNYFTLSGSDIYRSTGNVGIGTNDPDSRLHIEEPTSIGATTTLFHTETGFTGGSRGHFEIKEEKHGAGTGWSDFNLRLQRRVDSIVQGYMDFNPSGTDGDYGIAFGTGSTELMRIKSDGNVGIGTTSPGAKLDVNGAVILTGGGHGSRPANDGGVLANAEIRGGLGTGSAGFLRLSGGGYNNGSASDATSKSFIDLCGYSGTTDFDRNISFHTLNQERMRINLSGNVGIGTTSPGAPLHVNGDIAVGVSGSLRRTADNDLINIYSGSDNTSPYMFMTGKSRSSNANKIGFRIASATKFELYSNKAYFADNVGIGTTDPETKLHVKGGSICVHRTFPDTPDAGIVFMEDHSNKDCMFIAYDAGGTAETSDESLRFYSKSAGGADPTISGANLLMSMRADGNVGIGTSSPAYKLDVSGNLRVTTGIYDSSWCSGSWGQTCSQSPTVTVYSNNGGGPMSAPGHGGSGMGGNRGRFTAKKAGNYLISCCVVSAGRGAINSSGSNLLVTFQASGTNWNANNVINTYREILDLRSTPSVEEAYTFACQVYMNVGHYLSFQVHSSGYIDNSAYLLCSTALVR